MKSILIMSSVFTITALLFSGFSGILPKSYTSMNNILPDNFVELDKQDLLVKGIDSSQQLMQAGQYLMDGLSEGAIDEEWLETNGLDEDLLEGVETNQLMETTNM